MATVNDFEAWLREQGFGISEQQRQLAAAVFAAVESVGMTGRGAGKTWLLRRLDEFLSS